MILFDLILAVIVGIVFTAIIATSTYRGAGWGVLISLFLIFFFLPWAGALWFVPAGPPAFGTYWLPPIIIAVFILLLILALVPTSTYAGREAGEAGEASTATKVVGVFFWILIILSIIGIIIAYS